MIDMRMIVGTLRLLACAAVHAMLRWQHAAHCESSLLAVLGLEPLVGGSAYCRAVRGGLHALPLAAAAAVPLLHR